MRHAWYTNSGKRNTRTIVAASRASLRRKTMTESKGTTKTIASGRKRQNSSALKEAATTRPRSQKYTEAASNTASGRVANPARTAKICGTRPAAPATASAACEVFTPAHRATNNASRSKATTLIAAVHTKGSMWLLIAPASRTIQAKSVAPSTRCPWATYEMTPVAARFLL